MNPTIACPRPPKFQPSSREWHCRGTGWFLQPALGWAAFLAALLCLLLAPASARADISPPGCVGSGLGILLYTAEPDVHIGDTIHYGVTVFNGTGVGPVVCDASSIMAFVVTPDGITNAISLVRTNLLNGQSDYYADVVSYIVRAQDIQLDGTLFATAKDKGVIHQNIMDSVGGGFQGVNTIVSLPCIALAAQCTGSVGETGAITFSGTVTNCGNDTLVNVTVTNFVNGGAYPVTFITNILSGQVASFSGSYVPLNPCSPSTMTLAAAGTDQYTTNPRTVTSSATNTCSDILTAGILVTKTCPVQPVAPGQLLTFTGTVSNPGNVTLTGIIVVNNQPSANTTVFTAAALAPGAVTNFTGSYLAPTNCSVTDTLIATAASVCGIPVTNSASATCALITTPAISVSLNCPANPTLAGTLLTYTGTVTNTGNITLTNVVVLNNLSGPTPILTLAILAPGVGASFTGSYLAPVNCSSTSTAIASGQGLCGGAATNSVSATCAILTTPALTLTQNCPVAPVSPGGLLTYSGTVTNTGNITLTNVVIRNNLSGLVPIFTTPTLAPGAGASFTGSYVAPANCSVTSTSLATGQSICGISVTNGVSTTCAIVTTPQITVLRACPVIPALAGGLFTYSGSISNAGNIALTNVVVLDNLSGASPVFTAATLAPGATLNFTGSYLAPTNCSTTDTLVATATSICGSPVTNSASATCPLQTAPAIVVSETCPAIPVLPGGLLTFSGSVSNAGNIILTNIIVVSDRPVANTVVFAAAFLAPGATTNFSGSYPVPLNCCVVYNTLAAAGQGCSGLAITNTTTSACTVLTLPALVATKVCTAGLLRPGDLLTYSGTVSNSGNITLINVTVADPQSPGNPPLPGPVDLAPGQVVNFNGSYLVPPDFCGSDTVTAIGLNVCTSMPVTNSVTTTCPITTNPRLTVAMNCPLLPTVRGGLFTYTGSVSNAGNVSLVNVFVVNTQPTNQTPVLGPLTLAPGAVVNFTNSYVAPVCCCLIIDTLAATGQDHCSGSNVTASATAVCPLATTPSLALVQACPADPIPMGSLYNFSGYVTNTGDVVLTNVLVYGPDGVSALPDGPLQLAPGQAEYYFGAYTVPFNTCSVTITATGQETCGGTTGTNTTSCPVATVPLISITQNCPLTPAIAGGLLTYSGSVSNAGNITLTSVMVLNNLSGATPVFTAPLLVPGATAHFTGSYLAPANCFSTSLSTVLAQSLCGGAVSNAASSTCPIITTPLIVIAQNCPLHPTLPGGLLTYSGSVSNAGNIAFTNVVVLNNLSGITPVFTTTMLAPGTVTNFTGSYLAPTNCSSTSISTVIGQSLCGISVSNIASSTCPIILVPLIAITQNCPLLPAIPGGVLTYSGSVSNAGNTTFTNVVVLNNLSGVTPIFTTTMLAPGAVTNFTGSYLAPTNCSLTSISTVIGLGICGAATNLASSTCPIITTPLIVIAQNCPLLPAIPGGLLTYSGSVSNAGNTTFTNVVVLNNLSGVTPIFTTTMLAPGVVTNFTGSYLAPTNCSSTSISTVIGLGLCGAATNLASSTCPIITTPLIVIAQNCPLLPAIPGGLLTYSGSVSNAGNTTFTNVVVLNNLSGVTPIFTTTMLAPGAATNFTGSYLAPTNCSSTSISSVIGLGLCGAASNTVVSTCPITANPLIAITQNCPLLPAIPGGLLTYSGSVSNGGNTTFTNVVVLNNLSGVTPIFTTTMLAPGAVTNFTGSYLAPTNCSSTSISTVIGLGLCGAASNTVVSTCPITANPLIAITQNCPLLPAIPSGLLTYSGSVSNAGNTTFTNVVVLNNLSGVTPIFTTTMLAPGAVTNFTGSYLAPTNCSSTSISTVIGQGLCGAASNTVVSTCPITANPLIAITQNCPLLPAIPGGLLTYSGSVSNGGNTIFTNVVVLNNLSGVTPIFTTTMLAPGMVTNFTGSYLAPTNCSSTSISTVIGLGFCGAASNMVVSTCPITANPLIAITQNCPLLPAIPGGLLTYSGSVSNAGNTTFTNVVVLNNLSGVTPIFTTTMLAPGAVTNFTGSYLAPTNCSSTSISTVIGLGFCGAASNTVVSTCPITVNPRIMVVMICPATPVMPGGLLTYSGSVSNAGNIVLTNVVVLNNLSGATPVFTTATLAPGAVGNFTGSYLAPTNCSSTSISTVIGQGLCGAASNTVVSTCPITANPLIAITQNCPLLPAIPGGLLTYSGSVSNAGNTTFTNVVVLNNLSGVTPIFTTTMLAPGAVTNFTGSYLAPTNCSSTSISTVIGLGFCGAASNTVVSTCPITVNPRIMVVMICPATPVMPGGLLTYSGSVSNAGNIVLTNVVVLNNLSGATPVFTTATLAPGAVGNFTGSYLAPTNCSSTSISTATGQSCNLGATNSMIATCLITTTPAIAITETCSPGPVSAGSIATFSGLVSNPGNITLTNVLVYSSQPSNNTPVLGPIMLAPGASAPFTGSYVAFNGANPMTNTTILTNLSGVIITNTTSVIVTNHTAILTTNAVASTFGTIDPVTGILTDRFTVPGDLHGLMYADQDMNWGPTLFYTVAEPVSGPSTFDTISTIPPSVGVVSNRFNLTVTNLDSLTMAAPDVGYGAVNFYYLRNANNGATTFGEIIAQGASSAADLWAVPNSGYIGLAFAAANLGYDANLFYYVRNDASGLATFGDINPTPGGIATDLYTVGTNFDSLVFVSGAVSTWGTSLFAYLRHDTIEGVKGSIIGTIDPVTKVAIDRINLGTNYLNALTYTTTDVGYGPDLFYYLRPGGSLVGTNLITTFTTNMVITLVTNTLTTFITNSLVTFTPTNTVTTMGMDLCLDRTVVAAANCLGPVALVLIEPLAPLIMAPVMAGGAFNLSISTESGKTYTVQFKAKLTDNTWTNLPAFLGTGRMLIITNPTTPGQPTRFYRIMVSP